MSPSAYDIQYLLAILGLLIFYTVLRENVFAAAQEKYVNILVKGPLVLPALTHLRENMYTFPLKNS